MRGGDLSSGNIHQKLTSSVLDQLPDASEIESVVQHLVHVVSMGPEPSVGMSPIKESTWPNVQQICTVIWLAASFGQHAGSVFAGATFHSVPK